MTTLLLIAGVLLLSLFLTHQLRRYGLKHLLDIPNQRSSHQQPTPRGGGLAIVISFYCWVSGLLLIGLLEETLFFILLPSAAIALIGFYDDHQPLAARWRFLVHTLAAVVALLLMPQLPILSIGLLTMDLAWSAYILATLFLVWMLNLFNFMDGIDGIAGSEAIFVCSALAALMYNINVDLAMLAIGLVISCLGFLAYNWPPAKIFMGDVGSGFLGFIIGLLILLFGNQDPVFIVIGLILFAVFVADASYTLLYRYFDGQKWYQAHCTHAYQHAARIKGHKFVLYVSILFNVFWLLPLAIVVFCNPEYSSIGLIAAYLPLFYTAQRLHAGVAV